MSDAIDRVRAHFDSIAPKTIIVPEWADLEIHASPVTIAERGRIYAGDTKDEHELVCRILLVKAKDKDGKRSSPLPICLRSCITPTPASWFALLRRSWAGKSPDAQELGN
jgi:hypothetical protein